jgi:hypothetical protein
VIVLVAGATATMRRLQADVRFGRLIEPHGQHRPATLDLTPGRWAMDNGAFQGFRPGPFMTMLERHYGLSGCLWVAAPDVVGDAGATADRWPFWSAVIRAAGFPPAFVAQDGLTVRDAPWSEMAALFIGGTTTWKDSPAAADLSAYAAARGVPVHWGRVSTWKRLRHVLQHGGESCDTSGCSRWPDEMTGRFARWLTQADREPLLRW